MQRYAVHTRARVSLKGEWKTVNHHWQDMRGEGRVLKVLQSHITFSRDRWKKNTCRLPLTTGVGADIQAAVLLEKVGGGDEANPHSLFRFFKFMAADGSEKMQKQP